MPMYLSRIDVEEVKKFYDMITLNCHGQACEKDHLNNKQHVKIQLQHRFMYRTPWYYSASFPVPSAKPVLVIIVLVLGTLLSPLSYLNLLLLELMQGVIFVLVLQGSEDTPPPQAEWALVLEIHTITKSEAKRKKSTAILTIIIPPIISNEELERNRLILSSWKVGMNYIWVQTSQL